MSVQSLNFETDIKNCLKTLDAGGIILYPTDTVWGIGCDATNDEAVEKIITLKQRASNKSFVVLVASQKEVEQYVNDPDPAIFKYLEKTTKPTTVIYENARSLASNVIAADGSVAIRICKDLFCIQLIEQFGKPIVSTSANIGGEPTPQLFSQISIVIKQGVDYVVNHRQQEENLNSLPSAIIKWTNGKPFIIRE